MSGKLKIEACFLNLQKIWKAALRVAKVLNGLGIAIISTSKGVMTDKKARELSLGGEVLAYVW